MRIASLLPSATEIVCALGLADDVVGVSHECDYPTEIVGRTVLTEPKIDPRGTSSQIDVAVRDLVRDGLSIRTKFRDTHHSEGATSAPRRTLQHGCLENSSRYLPS